MKRAAPSAPDTFGWAGAASTFVWIDPANELVGLVRVHVLPSAVGILAAFRGRSDTLRDYRIAVHPAWLPPNAMM